MAVREESGPVGQGGQTGTEVTSVSLSLLLQGASGKYKEPEVIR